jgi:O-antigen ligase
MASATLTLGSVLTSNAPAERAAERRKLFAFVTLLTVVVYAMPIDSAWLVSTRDHYATSGEEMESAAVTGNLQRQVAFALLGLVGAIGCLWAEPRKLPVRGLIGASCAAYVLWCGLSLAWASEPEISVRRFALLICEALGALAFAKFLSPKQMVWLVFACSLTWLSVGVVAELSLGTLRPWEGEYRFAGIFHPNEMGAQCALLLMATLYLVPLVRTQYRPVLFAIVAFATIFLYLTASRTAQAVAVLCLAVGGLSIAVTHRRYVLLAGSVWLCALAAIIFQGPLFGVLENTAIIGRADSDVATLTGRIPLWEELGKFVAERPWTGYGYGGFWTPEHIADLSDTLSWSISSSHSSYVELALSVGYIGAVFCIMGFVLALWQSLRLEARMPHQGFAFIAMLLVYTLASGLMETTFGIAGSRPFFAMCAVAMMAAAETGRAAATFATPPLTAVRLPVATRTARRAAGALD